MSNVLTLTVRVNKIYWQLLKSAIKGCFLLSFLGFNNCTQGYNKIIKMDTNRYHTIQNNYIIA